MAERNLNLNLSMYEMDDHLDALLDTLEGYENPSLVPEGLTQEIAEYFGQITKKVDGTASYVRHLENLVDIADAEIKRLQKRKTACLNRVGRIKEMLLEWMRKHEIKSVKGKLNSINRQANSQPSVLIDDESQISGQFREIQVSMPMFKWCTIQTIMQSVAPEFNLDWSGVEQQIRKMDIRYEIEGGGTVPGARLETGEHVRIR